MAKLFPNSGDPDQMPRSAAFDLGLHCLPIIILRVSRLQWVNTYNKNLSAKGVSSASTWFTLLEVHVLMLSALSKIFSRRHFVIFFSYFSQETGFYISCKLSQGFDSSWKRPHWRQFLWNCKSCFLGKIRKCHQFIARWISLEGNRDKSCNEFIINIQTLSPTNWTCHLSDRFTTLWSSVVCRTRSLRSTVVTYRTGTPSCGPLQSPTRLKNIYSVRNSLDAAIAYMLDA